MSQHLLDRLIMFLLSMTPVFELRGSITYGALAQIPWYETFLLSVVGNMIPMPFVLIFGRKIFNWMKTTKLFHKIIVWLENKVTKKAKRFKKTEVIGLALFSSTPIPGTGMYTAALIAIFLEMRLKHAFLACATGILIAGVIMTLVAYGVVGGIFTIFK